MDTSVLEDIGLTGAEIKVFVTLLEVGSSRAGNIVEKSGLHNAVVHRAFHSLKEKGLITTIQEGKRNYYQAVEPRLLLQFIDEKRTRLKKLLPELEKQKKHANQKPIARLFQGKRGIKELIYLMIDTTARCYHAYGGPQKAHDLLDDHFWAAFHNKRIHKCISAHLIFHSSLRWWGNKLNKKRLTNVKYTAQEFEELTETIICGNKVAIIVYLDKPYGFLLNSREAARSYARYFGLLWKLGKK